MGANAYDDWQGAIKAGPTLQRALDAMDRGLPLAPDEQRALSQVIKWMLEDLQGRQLTTIRYTHND